MTTLAEKIKVMQAYNNNPNITLECRWEGDDSWTTLVKEPTWSWETNDYRVKQEPLERWVKTAALHRMSRWAMVTNPGTEYTKILIYPTDT